MPSLDDPSAGEQPSRRDFLRLSGAAMTLAAVAAACQRGVAEAIVPYTIQPSQVTPGIARFYATSMNIDGSAIGLLVETHEGRPTKIEGNPDHPSSLGATGPLQQAQIFSLYDPDRAQTVLERGQAANPGRIRELLLSNPQPGLRVILEPTSSPTIAALISQVQKRHPDARFVFHSPLELGSEREAAMRVFGRPLRPVYDFTRADTVLSIEADFLGTLVPGSVRYAHDWALRRRPSNPQADIIRTWCVESSLSVTGSMADERLRKRPSEITRIAAEVAAEVVALGRGPVGLSANLGQALARLRGGPDAAWAGRAARDLVRSGSRAVVIAGERQPPIVHALAHLMNLALGSGAVRLIDSPTIDAGAATDDLGALARDLREGRVGTLVIAGPNPVYDAPRELEFAAALRQARATIGLAAYVNETAAACEWSLPQKHFLETWGDGRAHDGTLSPVQPVLQPLEQGFSVVEVLALLAGNPNPSDRAIVASHWTAQLGQDGWRRALQRGIVDGTASPAVATRASWSALEPALAQLAPAQPGLELELVPDPRVLDGRFANNAWLQELPAPLTKLTWDNAALVSPSTAERLGIASENLIELSLAGRTLRIAALAAAGQADDVITVALGYGRDGSERTARGLGFDAFELRPRQALHYQGVELVRVFEVSDAIGRTHRVASPAPPEGRGVWKVSPAMYPLARTQVELDQHDRPVALVTTLAAYRRDPHFTDEHKGPVPSLMHPQRPSDQPQWAMSIDLSVCTSCNACVEACFVENNLMVVGKEDVRNGRSMHWLRIDTYFSGSRAVHQPMMCQHCELAPCEYVCPVNATVHSPDGLNEMIYNRCVGTRWCSNNCPYKVRRFNWFDYHDGWPAPEPNRGRIALGRNPEVTVRGRGVMEKCTYCVQRIRTAEIRAEVSGRPFDPRSVQTACQQACPTRAIEFGSLTGPRDTPMMRYRDEPRSYEVLHDEGTRPRTMYLARVDNPAPEREP